LKGVESTTTRTLVSVIYLEIGFFRNLGMTIPELIANNLIWSESLVKDLQRFLTGRLKCPEIAADLTHETYLRLDRNVNKDNSDNTRALAFHIAANLAIDHERKVAVRKRYASNNDFDEVLEVVSDNSSQPETMVLAQEQLSIVKKALAELPVNCRTAFYLHTVEGLSYSEIATRMGISKSMVNKLLSKTLAYLTLQLEK
jgi:RNA polymerase sigma factor (sigma-70 family)